MEKLFKKLKKGLEEAVAYREGKITLKSEIIEIPKPPSKYKVDKSRVPKNSDQRSGKEY